MTLLPVRGCEASKLGGDARVECVCRSFDAVVRATPRGTRNVYQVNPRGLAALRQYIDAMWDRSLTDFKAVAEASYQRRRRRK
jgi:hypothetical protein